MSVPVVSFYMNNIPPEVIQAQRSVVELFLPADCEFSHILTEKSHGEAIDEYVASSSADVIVLLDIDAIPLRPNALTLLIEHANRGELAGVVQRSNHIENNAHLFVAPCAMAFKRALWEQAGRPSFKPTGRGDVAEEFTYACEERGLPVSKLDITYSEGDIWDLTDGRKYGHCTEYGHLFFHAFEIRVPFNQQRFVAKCKDILRRENPTIAVVTPYCTESPSIINRCIESVMDQTIPCRHYLIGDGDEAGGLLATHRHVVLGAQHWNYGNTPRAIGAMLAIAESADAIAFLDADNTFDQDHIETCWNLAKYNPRLHYVGAKRRIALPDGTLVPDHEEENLIDTSCFFLLPGSYHAIPQWALQPKPLSPVCDRLFHSLVRRLRLSFAETDRPTVTFNSTYAAHYRAGGLNPPDDAKPNPDLAPAVAWWEGLSLEQKNVARCMLGLSDFDIRK